MNIEDPPMVMASDSVLPSSPPPPPLPPEAPSYSMSLKYSLLLNGQEITRDPVACLNVFFTMDIIENYVKKMMDSTQSGYGAKSTKFFLAQLASGIQKRVVGDP